MTARSAWYVVVAIIMLRWWFGLAYSLSVPAWEAYDEPGHYSYAVTLATTGQLPDAEEAARNPEAIQPPLYYALMASMLWLSGTDVTTYQAPDRNPQFYANNGSVNYALHRRQLTSAAQDSETALRFLRLFTLLTTLPAVAMAYRLFKLLIIQRLAICTLLFALWPQALFNGSIVTNDALALTLGTLLSWRMLRALKVGFTVREMLLMLALISVGTMVKLNLLLMVFPFGVLLMLTTRRRTLLLIGTMLVIAVVLGVLSSVQGILIPLNSLSAQGEPMMMAIWRNLTSDHGWTLVPDGLRYLVHSSVGLFGWGNIALPVWTQALIAILPGAAILGSVAGMRRRASQQTMLLASIIVAQIAGGMALMLFYQTIHLLNGRYLLPALAAICALLVGGWAGLGRRGERIVSAVVVIGLASAGIAIPPYIASFYARPPIVTSYPVRDLHAYQAWIRLVGYEVAAVDRVVTVSLYWSAAQTVMEDYFVRITLIGADGNGYGLFDTIPGRGNHPTTNWIPGEVFRDDYRVPLRADAPLGKGHIRVTLVNLRNPKDTVSFDLVDTPFDIWVLR